MPDSAAPSSFEHVLESDLQRLAAEVKSQRVRPEMKDAAGEVLLKEAIRAFPELNRGKEGEGNVPAATSAAPTNDAMHAAAPGSASPLG